MILIFRFEPPEAYSPKNEETRFDVYYGGEYVNFDEALSWIYEELFGPVVDKETLPEAKVIVSMDVVFQNLLINEIQPGLYYVQKKFTSQKFNSSFLLVDPFLCPNGPIWKLLSFSIY